MIPLFACFQNRTCAQMFHSVVYRVLTELPVAVSIRHVTLHLIDHLSDNRINAATCLRSFPLQGLTIIITENEIYLPGKEYVFGACLIGSVAIVSTFRLRNPECLTKVLLHEIGHLLGLLHCTNQCVMEFSRNDRELRLKCSSFCHWCRVAVFEKNVFCQKGNQNGQ
jgi:predicted Zn-dependent protease